MRRLQPSKPTIRQLSVSVAADTPKQQATALKTSQNRSRWLNVASNRPNALVLMHRHHPPPAYSGGYGTASQNRTRIRREAHTPRRVAPEPPLAPCVSPTTRHGPAQRLVQAESCGQPEKRRTEAHLKVVDHMLKVLVVELDNRALVALCAAAQRRQCQQQQQQRE